MNHQEMGSAIDRSYRTAADSLRSDQLAGHNAMMLRHNILLDEVERERRKRERRAKAARELGVQAAGRELIVTTPAVQVADAAGTAA